MAIIIGMFLALAVGIFATLTGIDRDRSFYPVVTIVIATYYVLFAIMAAHNASLVAEILVFSVFLAAAVAGFRWSLWVIVAALFGHGVFDFTHSFFISNPGVPDWWPGFCLTYDISAAIYLAWLIKSGHIRSA